MLHINKGKPCSKGRCGMCDEVGRCTGRMRKYHVVRSNAKQPDLLLLLLTSVHPLVHLSSHQSLLQPPYIPSGKGLLWEGGGLYGVQLRNFHMEIAFLALGLVLLDGLGFGRMWGVRWRFLVGLFAGGTHLDALAQEGAGLVLGGCFFQGF